MRFICIFLPAIVMCGVRRLLIKKERTGVWDDIKSCVAEYGCCCLIINACLILLLAALGKDMGAIYEQLGKFSGTAVKYIFAAVAVAMIVPTLEKCVRDRYSLSVNLGPTSKVRAISTGGGV